MQPYSLSLQFHLGDVMNWEQDDESQMTSPDSAFFVQYEADIFKPLLMDLGHVHEFGVTVETTHTRDRLYTKGVYTDFSLPVGSSGLSLTPLVIRLFVHL